MRSNKSWMLAALVLSLTMGCDRGAKPQEAESVVGSQDATDASHMVGTVVESDLVVTLLPEEPLPTDDLRAVIRGSSGPFALIWKKNGESIVGQNQTRLRHSGLIRGDVIQVIVSSGAGQASAEVVISNSPPSVLSVTSKVSYLCRGVNLEVEPRGGDADGDTVEFRYLWRVNEKELFYETGPSLPGDSFRKGDSVELVITPRDGIEDGEPFSEGLIFEVGNAPPLFVSSPPTSIGSLEYRYQALATDADEEEVVYRLAKGPEGMNIDSESGLVGWSIPTDASGIYEVRIEARDAEGMIGWQEYTLEIGRGEAGSS